MSDTNTAARRRRLLTSGVLLAAAAIVVPVTPAVAVHRSDVLVLRAGNQVPATNKSENTALALVSRAEQIDSAQLTEDVHRRRVSSAATRDGWMWLSAVNGEGTLYTRRGKVGKGWSRFTKQGTTGTWASADLAATPDGWMWLSAVKKNGTLYTRRGKVGKGWSRFTKQGTTGTWLPASTYSAPNSNPYPPDITRAPDATQRTQFVDDEIFRLTGERDCWVGEYRTYQPWTSNHNTGNALDCTISDAIGTYPDTAQREQGWRLANWLRQYASQLQLRYVIWDGRIWSVARSSEGWRAYTAADGVTGGHYDHVHVSIQNTLGDRIAQSMERELPQ